MITTVVNEATGEERKRLINKGRWKGYGPHTITFLDSNVAQLPYPHRLCSDTSCSFHSFHSLPFNRHEILSKKIY